MTGGRKSRQQIRHLEFEDIETIYSVLFMRFAEIGEPIPHFNQVNKREVRNLVEIPQTKYFENEQYPTLESKATILFYKINKGHIFPNGNKRISLACLFIFLASNGYQLEITEDEATSKALEVAQSDPQDFQKIKDELEQWIKERIRENENITKGMKH
jgi:death-on-curing protein